MTSLTRLARPASPGVREASLNEIVGESVTLARHNPVAASLKIGVGLDPELPAVVVVPEQILQVFLNLILNAAEAGGELAISTHARGDRAAVIFADTGHGMSTEQVRRVFDPFYSTKSGDGHVGLGLFVSHEIVRQHGGVLTADSVPERGSTFTVALPIGQARGHAA